MSGRAERSRQTAGTSEAAQRDAAAPVERFEFSAEVWEHDGEAAWHFVSLPNDFADDIAERHAGRAAGFGSIKVMVTIGTTRWSTSLFPDSKRGTYVLPLKRQVRRAEHLAAGDTADVTIEIAP